MAKNWRIAEALKIITAGEDLRAIRDIGRRFPLFLFFVLRDPSKIIQAFGERVTARTVNKQLEESLENIPGVDVDNKEETKKLDKKKKKKEKVDKMKKEKIEEVEAKETDIGLKEVDMAKGAIVENIAEQTDKEIVKKEKKEVKIEEEIEDEKIEDDDLDFNVEDLLEK